MRRPREIYHLALLPRARRLGRRRSAARSRRCSACSRRPAATVSTKVVVGAAGHGAVRPPGRPRPAGQGGRARAPRRARRGRQGDRRPARRAYREAVRHRVHGARPDDGVRPAPATRRRRRGGVVAAAAGGEAPGVTGDGRQTRDFVLRRRRRRRARPRSGQRGSGLVVNIGTGVQTSLRDLWTPIAPDGPAPTLGAGPTRRAGPLRRVPVRARIHLGWSPWTTLAEASTRCG